MLQLFTFGFDAEAQTHEWIVYIYSGLSNIPSFSLVSNKLSLSKHWVVRLHNTQDICELETLPRVMRHQPAPSSAIGEDCEEGKGENANIQIANVWKGMVELEILIRTRVAQYSSLMT